MRLRDFSGIAGPILMALLLLRRGADCLQRSIDGEGLTNAIQPRDFMQRRKGFVFAIRIFLLLLIVQLGPPRLLARQTLNYATVSGRVADPTDAVVPGAEIVARQTSTNLISSATTDQDGRFRFPYLRPGP